jgi:hypothetical protein
MMKYPKETGPQSQTEMYAWLFGMLSNAYNMLAQYEKDEIERERQDMIDMLDKAKRDKESRNG